MIRITIETPQSIVVREFRTVGGVCRWLEKELELRKTRRDLPTLRKLLKILSDYLNINILLHGKSESLFDKLV